MLIIALVLAVVGLAALVTAVVTSNELIAWVCIAASVIGVVLLIVDAVRERSGRSGETRSGADEDDDAREDADEDTTFDAEYPEDSPHADADTTAVPIENRDDEVVGEDRSGR